MHGVRLREIALDLSPDAHLRTGQHERQPPDQRGGMATRFFDRHPKLGCPARPALAVVLAHRELLRQQLVEFHAPPGGKRATAESRRVRSGTGMMQRVDSFAKTAQAELPAHVFGQRVIERSARERVFDQAPQPSLRERSRGRIDRRQRGRQRRHSVKHAKARMDHFSAKNPSAYFSEGAHRRAALKRFGLAPKEIEEAQHQLARGILDSRDQLAPGPVRDLSRAHGAFHLHGQAGRSARNRGDACLVLVAQRQVQHEIELPVNSDARELLLKRRVKSRQSGVEGNGAAAATERRFAPVPAFYSQRRTLNSQVPSERIASASTSAPRGSAATPTTARAG